MNGVEASAREKGAARRRIFVPKGTLENESSISRISDDEAIRKADKRYVKIGAAVALLTVITASSVIAFSVHSIYSHLLVQQINLRSAPYIVAIAAALIISMVMISAVVRNSPHLVRLRRESKENKISLAAAKENLVRHLVFVIEGNFAMIKREKSYLKELSTRETSATTEIDTLSNIETLYSKICDIEKARNSALERCLKESYEIVDAKRDDLDSSLNHHGKLIHNVSVLRNSLRKTVDQVNRATASLRKCQNNLLAKQIQHNKMLLDLDAARIKANGLYAKKHTNGGPEHKEALRSYQDIKDLAEKLAKEVDATNERIRDLEEEIKFLNDDKRNIQAALEQAQNRLKGLEGTLHHKQASIDHAITLRDSASRDLMSNMMGLANRFTETTGSVGDPFSVVYEFLKISNERKEAIANLKDARESSFNAYIALNNAISATPKSVVGRSEYLRSVKRKDFLKQMRGEWSHLDMAALEREYRDVMGMIGGSSNDMGEATVSEELAEKRQDGGYIVDAREFSKGVMPNGGCMIRKESHAASGSRPAGGTEAPTLASVAPASTDVSRTASGSRPAGIMRTPTHTSVDSIGANESRSKSHIANRSVIDKAHVSEATAENVLATSGRARSLQ